MNRATPDSWSRQKTTHGFSADQVISALQKEIRRGHTENAVLLAHEMITTGTELEEFLWRRLLVISVEDVGFGDTGAAVLVNALNQMRSALGEDARDRELFAVHSIRHLCGCPKDRSSDEMTLWVKMAAERGRALPSIPEYALDKHTAAGKKMGRGLRHFMEEGARVRPEVPDRDRTYRERITAMLDEQRRLEHEES